MNEIFFISPHYDDAVLSVSSYLDILAKQTKVTVITVFTQRRDFFGKNMQQGDRACEERAAAALLGYRIVELPFTDAPWRKGGLIGLVARIFPGLIQKYPQVLSLFSAEISDAEPLVKEVGLSLRKLIHPKAIVFAPLALGNHIDHLIVASAVKKLGKPIVWWEDIPYKMKNKFKQLFTQKGYAKIARAPLTKKKEQLINCYASQDYLAHKIKELCVEPEVIYCPISRLSKFFRTNA